MHYQCPHCGNYPAPNETQCGVCGAPIPGRNPAPPPPPGYQPPPQYHPENQPVPPPPQYGTPYPPGGAYPPPPPAPDYPHGAAPLPPDYQAAPSPEQPYPGQSPYPPEGAYPPPPPAGGYPPPPPPPPAYYPLPDYTPEARKATLVLGIVGIVFATFWPLVTWGCSIPGLVMAIQDRNLGLRGSTAPFVLNIIALGLSLIGLVTCFENSYYYW